MIKFGKKYSSIAAMKKDFLAKNDRYLEKNNIIAKSYQKQNRREYCKLCNKNLIASPFFTSHGIKYYICSNCGHVCGEYEETSEFTSSIYERSDYGVAYRTETKAEYFDRLNKIYVPKAKFMTEVFAENNVPYNNIRYLDIGAGSGYFVGALLGEGLNATGIEVSNEQVSFGNRMLGKELLACLNEDSVKERIEEATEEVISFIGVLEHVVNLNEILDAVSNNKNIKYIFFSVPMFSYSVIWEALSQSVFNRQLGGAHTHLFTESSLSFLQKKYDWNVMGEWRFGTDVADLLRTGVVNLLKDNNKVLADIYQEKLNAILDDIQLIIDKEKFCSEMHMLVSK